VSLPNKDVVTALFESYLNSRAVKWGLDVNDPKASQLIQPGPYKIKMCGEILLKVEKAQSIDDWVKIVHLLAEKQAVEAVTLSSNWTRPLVNFVGYFIKSMICC